MFLVILMKLKLVYDGKNARVANWDERVKDFEKLKGAGIKLDSTLPAYTRAQVVNLSHAFTDRVAFLFSNVRKLASANQASGAYLRRADLSDDDQRLLERLTQTSDPLVHQSAVSDLMVGHLATLEDTVHGSKLKPTDLCLLAGAALGKVGLNLGDPMDPKVVELSRLAVFDLVDLTASVEYFAGEYGRYFLAGNFRALDVDYRFDLGESTDALMRGVSNNTNLMCSLVRQTYFGLDQGYVVPPSNAQRLLEAVVDSKHSASERLKLMESYTKPSKPNEGYMRFFDLCAELFLNPNEDAQLRAFAQQFMLEVTGVAKQLMPAQQSSKKVLS